MPARSDARYLVDGFRRSITTGPEWKEIKRLAAGHRKALDGLDYHRTCLQVASDRGQGENVLAPLRKALQGAQEREAQARRQLGAALAPTRALFVKLAERFARRMEGEAGPLRTSLLAVVDEIIGEVSPDGPVTTQAETGTRAAPGG